MQAFLPGEGTDELRWKRYSKKRMHNNTTISSRHVKMIYDLSLSDQEQWCVPIPQVGFSLMKKYKNIKNVLILKTVLSGLRTLAQNIKSTHIKILCCNSTVVACINKFGISHSPKCSVLTKQIWEYSHTKSNWFLESRKDEVHIEWKLGEIVFPFIWRELN